VQSVPAIDADNRVDKTDTALFWCGMLMVGFSMDVFRKIQASPA
jgi:hypothetical protein